MCRRTTAARALHPSLSLEIAEAHLGKDHLDLIVGARYLVVGGGLTRRRTMTRLLSYSDGGANQFDTVGLLLQELSAQQLRQRGARCDRGREAEPEGAAIRSRGALHGPRDYARGREAERAPRSNYPLRGQRANNEVSPAKKMRLSVAEA